MKNSIFILLPLIFLFSCKKENEPPPELLGKWDLHYIEHIIYDQGTYNTWTDTISVNPKTFEFRNDWSLLCNRFFPNCPGRFKLSENNTRLDIWFDCNTATPYYTILYTSSDSLVLQKDGGVGIDKQIYLK